jgi:HEAT repeat protein
MQFQSEAEALKKSSWPKCDHLAQALAEKGGRAADALEFATTSRILHVRGAALKALATIAPERGKTLAQAMLNDRAYEVRETAANILGVPIPG